MRTLLLTSILILIGSSAFAGKKKTFFSITYNYKNDASNPGVIKPTQRTENEYGPGLAYDLWNQIQHISNQVDNSSSKFNFTMYENDDSSKSTKTDQNFAKTAEWLAGFVMDCNEGKKYSPAFLHLKRDLKCPNGKITQFELAHPNGQSFYISNIDKQNRDTIHRHIADELELQGTFNLNCNDIRSRSDKLNCLREASNRTSSQRSYHEPAFLTSSNNGERK